MGIKRLLRPTVDRLAHLSGQLRHHERAMREGVTILIYHRVLEDEAARDYPWPSLAMPCSAFRTQMRWLKDHTEVLTLSDALARCDETTPSPLPIVCVTFDDGYRDNVEIAAPILAECRVPATFFVTVGLIGTQELFWFDRAALAYRQTGRKELGNRAGREFQNPTEWLEFLKTIPPEKRDELIGTPDPDGGAAEYTLMDWDQVHALRAGGHEIGSHTLTHPILPDLEDDSLEHEIAESKLMLESGLGEPVPGFCYPNGDHDARVIEVVKRAGYTWACSTLPGRFESGHDRFAIPRLDITPRRVVRDSGEPDVLGFRSEISLLRNHFRTRKSGVES